MGLQLIQEIEKQIMMQKARLAIANSLGINQVWTGGPQ